VVVEGGLGVGFVGVGEVEGGEALGEGVEERRNGVGVGVGEGG
jgi:hypothetical protein